MPYLINDGRPIKRVKVFARIYEFPTGQPVHVPSEGAARRLMEITRAGGARLRLYEPGLASEAEKAARAVAEAEERVRAEFEERLLSLEKGLEERDSLLVRMRDELRRRPEAVDAPKPSPAPEAVPDAVEPPAPIIKGKKARSGK